jgi:hypothetical protein
MTGILLNVNKFLIKKISIYLTPARHVSSWPVELIVFKHPVADSHTLLVQYETGLDFRRLADTLVPGKFTTEQKARASFAG